MNVKRYFNVQDFIQRAKVFKSPTGHVGRVVSKLHDIGTTI